MLKNKEIKIFLIVQVLCILATVVLVKLQIIEPIYATIIEGVLFIGLNMLYVTWRYHEISKLTQYLVKIQKEEKALDIRDNTEGELSILKNEIYKLSIKLNTQAETLYKDKRYLADSLSDISHQLKTPLTSMLMMVDFLRNENLPSEKREEFLNNLTAGVERMQWLVLSLLKLSKLDANAVVFKHENVEIESLLHRAVEPLLISADIKNVELKLHALEEKVYIKGDMLWLAEALTNIIKNCLEHTLTGGKVEVSYEDNNFYTKIMIEDNGEGIHKEDLPHIFERFYKGNNANRDSVGIGLALAKQIIIQQKGTIEVQSSLGVGTRFEIRIYR